MVQQPFDAHLGSGGIVEGFGGSQREGWPATRRLAAGDDVIGAVVVRAKRNLLDLVLIRPHWRVAALHFADLQSLVLVEEVIEAIGGAERVQGLAVLRVGLNDETGHYLAQLAASADIQVEQSSPRADFQQQPLDGLATEGILPAHSPVEPL